MASYEGLRFPLPEKQLRVVAATVKDFAFCQGLLMGIKDGSAEVESYVPFTLFPSAIQRSCFEEALGVQTAYNHLMYRVAQDFEFLEEALTSTIKADDFIRQLWDILIIVRKENSGQPICLNLNRSDYMVDMKDPSNPCIKQIEFNTMAAGLGGIAGQLSALHRYTLDVCGVTSYESKLPDNPACTELAKSLLDAWTIYGKERSAVLFVVEMVTRNTTDQRWLEFKMYDLNPKVTVLRKTLVEIYDEAILTDDRRLMIDDTEISVVYYRCGYIPEQCNTCEQWEARLKLERSLAIKCPSVQSHLAGCKKIQEVLTRPGVLERFLQDKETIRKLRKTFAGLYTLDLNTTGDKAVELALKKPGQFVMKPEREGGGNNLFGEDITKELTRLRNSEERAGYILMERIFPPIQKNYLLRTGHPVDLFDVVSELGVFGALIGNGNSILENKLCGYLLRTKPEGSNEGGIYSDSANLDTPYLTD